MGSSDSLGVSVEDSGGDFFGDLGRDSLGDVLGGSGADSGWSLIWSWG